MPFYANPFHIINNHMFPFGCVPVVEYRPKVNYPSYPGMPRAQVINALPTYPPHLWMQTQETMATVQYYFSFDNLLQDPYLQSRMNRSLWVPLNEIHKFNKLVFLGISFRQLQAFARRQMFSCGCSFELDKTGTLIRPNWGKASMINFRLSCKAKINGQRRIRKARKIIMKALNSVANSEQVSLETEDINLLQIGQEKDGSVSAYFNAPGIPSLIKEFMDVYFDRAWRIQVTRIKDSMVFSRDT